MDIVVGNSLGRAPLGGRETEAWTRWTDRKPREIAWGELHWEGTDGSNDWVDGRETAGNIPLGIWGVGLGEPERRGTQPQTPYKMVFKCFLMKNISNTIV